MALVKEMVDDTIQRAIVERDGRLWAALVLFQRTMPLHVAVIAGPAVTGHPNFRAVDPSASADSRGVNRTTPGGVKVKDAVADAILRAQAERDGRLWANLHFIQTHLGPLGDQVVPDVTGMAPFRAVDASAAVDTRGVNRTS